MSPRSHRPSRRGKRSAERPVSRTVDPLRYASVYHAPVMAAEVLEGLVWAPDGLYVDATLGGGGHSEAILAATAPLGRVIGIDQDADALEAAADRLEDAAQEGRFSVLKGNFRDLGRLLKEAGVDQVDGILLDLGVSSHQIDEASRGFAFRADGPLDMRMNASTGETAEGLIDRLDVQALTDLLRVYGEEPRAWPVANAIVQSRPLKTTSALAAAVRSAVPVKEEVKTLARVFQALRIAVNDEVGALEQVLKASLEALRVGGRLAVISYHSLEDRRVKRFMKFGNLEGIPEKDFYGNLHTPWTTITRKPVTATDVEVAANPRARSARLRIAQKKPRTSSRDSGSREGAGPSP
ncbi:MAG: 16S rRNA (cytosine(1402)-N(4))-methyltransferase RsmH [Rubricoccaceae bacterium]|nr:16S rRNA (cytosine(1402)-N(4))-methyltransferase RsmH [Rubricoccaceae bacterium]